MKNIGAFLAVAGILATVLDFFGRVPKMLFWIYNWGDTMSWVIKIAMIALGAMLWFYGNKPTKTEQ